MDCPAGKHDPWLLRTCGAAACVGVWVAGPCALRLTVDDTVFTSLWGFAGWLARFTAPFVLATLALGACLGLARGSRRPRVWLGSGGALAPLGLLLLTTKLHHLERDGLAPLASLSRAAEPVAAHPVEALLTCLAAGFAWLVVGGARLLAPRRPGLQLRVAALVAAWLAVNGLALLVGDVDAEAVVVAALILPFTIGGLLLVERWAPLPPPLPAPTRRSLRHGVLAAALGALLLQTGLQAPHVYARWAEYRARQHDRSAQARHPSPQARSDAVRRLGQLGRPGRQALLRLLELGPGSPVHDQAAAVLAESGDPELIPQILDVFQHSHFSSVDAPVHWRGSGWACAKAIEALEGAPER